MNYKFLAAWSLVVGIFFFSTEVRALPIEPIIKYRGNIHQLTTAEINKLIAAVDPSLPDIKEQDWPFNQIEIPTELDIKSYTFDDLRTNYLVTKEGNKSYVYDVRGRSTVNWESNDGKGLSYHATVTVPDASIMLLLGPALITLGILGRRKSFR